MCNVCILYESPLWWPAILTAATMDATVAAITTATEQSNQIDLSSRSSLAIAPSHHKRMGVHYARELQFSIQIGEKIRSAYYTRVRILIKFLWHTKRRLTFSLTLNTLV